MTLLLETKFHIPNTPQRWVQRPRLIEALQTGLVENRKLSLVAATAGYGKTSLVADWLQQAGRKSTWLSLDEDDNDLVRFLAYLIAAVQKIKPELGVQAQDWLDQDPLPPLTSILDKFINELCLLSEPIIIVLDDFQFIHNQSIISTIEYLIEHLPHLVHLVITTRSDPALPLARLRARGQMTEIRAHDLRFSLTEAQEFFKQSLDKHLETEIIQLLEARTEGWAAGLQLACLALQNLPQPQDFIESFRGSHRYVLDYLAEEVIRQQPEEIRSFLMLTSVLERFNAELCNNLLEKENSKELLNQLELKNLFLIPLDNQRNWHRYHHLFGDYLRSCLEKKQASELNKKASLWHEQNNLVFEAVKYAFASRDMDFCAGLIERAMHKETTWSDGRVSTLAAWLDALPAASLHTHPRLSIFASRILYLNGRFEQAEKLLKQAEKSLREQPQQTAELEPVLAVSALYRGAIAAMRGEVGNAREQIALAQAQLPKEDALAHARAAYSLGLVSELAGETRQSVEQYLSSSQLAMEAGVLYLAINARCAAAIAQITLGELDTAAHTCQETIELAHGTSQAQAVPLQPATSPPQNSPQAQGTHLPPLGLAWSILGAIAYEKDELSSAAELLETGLALSKVGGLQDDLNVGLLFASRQKFAAGDLPGAKAALEQVRSIVQRYQIERTSILFSAYQARLLAASGDDLAAAAWAKTYQAQRNSTPVEYLREFEDLTLARILIQQGELDEALSMLEAMFIEAQRAGRLRTCIEAMLLLSQCYSAKKAPAEAIHWLQQALEIAAPAGFLRLFLDEGIPILDMLPRVRAAAPAFVDEIFSRSSKETQASDRANEQLPEPLTEQEMQVLQSIIAGKSNREIAGELFISTGTAKWHVHNILRKLSVSNRVQAVARARELGME